MSHEELSQSVIAYRDTVFRVSLGYVKNIHDADDITQNTFMKLYSHGKNFPSNEARNRRDFKNPAVHSDYAA